MRWWKVVAGRGTVASIPNMRTGARLVGLILLLAAAVVGQEVAPPASAIDPQVAALAAARAKYVYVAGVFRWFTEDIDGANPPRERQGDFAVVRATGSSAAMYNVFTCDLQKADMHRWCSDGTTRWQIEQTIEGEAPSRRQFKPGIADVDRDRVVACVLLDLPTLSKEFTIVRTADHAGDRLVFTPRDAALAGDLAAMTVVLVDGVPTTVIIDDTHNTRIRLVITKLEQAEEVPKDLNELIFRPVPKGM